MTIERFLYEGFRDEETYTALKDSPAFPLVRELEFKHGLKVLRHCTAQDKDGYNVDSAFLMVNRYGIAVGKAYAHLVETKMTYCFYTPHYNKERGSSHNDRHTIHSGKISSLMATLTRHKVIPTPEQLVNNKMRVIKNLMEEQRRGLGQSEKSTMGWTANELHAVFLMALGKSPNTDWVQVDQNKCIETLDKWEEADRVAKVKIEEGKRLFANPFYLVGSDHMGDYLIGKFRVSSFSTDNVETEVIEPFKRYASYESVPDLIPVMTMMKLSFETKDTMRKLKNGFPVWDGYDAGLDAAFYYNSSPTEYEQVFMATSCPLNS